MPAGAKNSAEVLIVGAGPTGLVLAIWLTRLGARVRIVEKLDAPETTSRAIGVLPRTLEYYRQLNLADTLIAHGRKAPATNLWVDGRNVARLPFGEMGGEISPYPFALVISQDVHERLLEEHLAGLGVLVERRTELAGLSAPSGRVIAQLKHSDGSTETCETAWLAGCDGARSLIREILKIDFPGGTYEDRFYVADVLASGPALNGEMLVALDERDFLASFPLPGEGSARLIGTMRAGVADGVTDWRRANQRVMETLRLKIERVNWFSTYQVHHRIAARFRCGNIFLAGDAAHIHTPVGGQGLNTGVGDAINLAWKLAAVLHGRADPSLLDTYEPERRAVAQSLVTTTDNVFTGVTSQKPFDRWARRNFVPFIVPQLLKISRARKFLFRIISQCGVHYRGSGLSAGRAGDIRGGDRLPWVPPTPGAAGDNFSPLDSMDWQVHVCGVAGPGIQNLCAQRGLPLHVDPWRMEARRAGYRRDAIYLVRPDGHVALAAPEDGAEAVAAYLAARKLKPQASAQCPAGVEIKLATRTNGGLFTI